LHFLFENFRNFYLKNFKLIDPRSENDLRKCVEAFVKDIEIDETTIPFGATAVDLWSGKRVLISTGAIVRAVMASCAVKSLLLRRHRKENVDIMIEPAVGDMSWTKLFKYQESIRIGESAAEMKLEEMRQAVKPEFSEKILRWPWWVFNAKLKNEAAEFKNYAVRQLKAG
jgi:predicted acylesterase/phospholipase RssA